jgi:hypothetical protein
VVAVPVPVHLRKIRALQAIERARRRLRLGFKSERYTAQYLNEFLRVGGEVLHDYPLGGGEAIDHVLVVPQGIFTFESKGCESPVAGLGGTPAVAAYDGEAIRFPGQRCTAALVQAKRHARHVQQLLADRLGHTLPVVPAVALPGWSIEHTTPRENHKVQVLNPKDTASLLERCAPRPVLAPEHIQMVATVLRDAAELA